jgi:hypothetical protein
MDLALKHDPDLGGRSLHDLWANPVNPPTGQKVLLRFAHIGRCRQLAQKQFNRFFKMFGPRN